MNNLINNWNNGYCMAHLNNNNSILCKLRTKNNFDFCHKHLTKSNYDENLLNNIRQRDSENYIVDIDKLCKEINDNIYITKMTQVIDNFINKNKYLDTNYQYNLLNLYESWNEISLERQIKLDDDWWDIDIVINHMTQQLNNSNMENPYPIYPNNPFNRKPFTVESLKILKQRIKLSNTQINISLKFLLNQKINQLKLYYKEACNNNDRYSEKILDLFNKNLRYRIVNNKNSQGIYNGFWTRKIEELSLFEQLYTRWKTTPYQTFVRRTNRIIDNPYKDYLEELLEKYKNEDYNLNNNDIIETL